MHRDSVLVVSSVKGKPVSYPSAPAAGVQSSTNGLAIASLVTSLVGASLIGIVLGHMAQKQIRVSGQQGSGLAMAGLVIGYLGLAVGFVIFAISFSAGLSGGY
jgi:hypothetical protein